MKVSVAAVTRKAASAVMWPKSGSSFSSRLSREVGSVSAASASESPADPSAAPRQMLASS